MRSAMVCVMALALAACSAITAPSHRDVAFSGRPGRAYLLVAAGPPEAINYARYGGVETYVFERVDLASAKFLREYVFVARDDSSEPKKGPRDEFLKPETMVTSPFKFLGRSVATGEYALVEYVTRTEFVVHTDCFTLGSPVYRLQDGAINVVPVGSAAHVQPEMLKEQAEQLMKGYPAMAAPVVVAERLGLATYDTKQVLGKKTCFTRSPFTLEPLPAN